MTLWAPPCIAHRRESPVGREFTLHSAGTQTAPLGANN